MAEEKNSGDAGKPVLPQGARQDDSTTPDVADRIMQAFQDQAVAVPPSDSTQTPPTDDPEHISLDLGDGVVQSIAKTELLDLWKNRAELQEAQKTAEKILTRSVGAKSLADAIDAMTPQQQQMVLAVIQDPSRLESPQPSSNGDDDELSVDALLKGTPRGKAPDSDATRQLLERFGTLEKAVASVIREKQMSELGGQLDQTMRSFDVFNPDKRHLYTAEGATFARDALMREIAQNPNVDMRQAVARYATAVHKIKGQGAQVPPPVDPRARRFEADEVRPSKPLTGDQLMSGGVAAAISELLGHR